MKRAKFSLGDVQVNCFQSDSGEYLYSLTDVGAILSKTEDSPRKWLGSKSFKSLPRGDFKPRKLKQGNVTYSLVPSWVVTEYLLHNAMSNGDKLAGQVISLLTQESLDNRAALVLDGNTQAVRDNTDAELTKLQKLRKEQLTLKAGTLFTNWMRVLKLPTTRTHDYLTSKLVGRTAKQSRKLPLTYPDRTQVGLNHYPSEEYGQMELITQVKLFCASNLGVRQGWNYQTYIDFAIEQLAD